MNYKQALAAMQAASNLTELKQLYRAFALQFHPDRGGSEEAMKAINGTFSKMFEILKTRQNDTAAEQHQKGNWKGYATTSETPEEFIDIVSKLNRIEGIVIELCGTWIWISGDTREHRAELKAAGCIWSKGKQKWYWRHVEDFCKKSRKRSELSIEAIRELYGSQIINNNRNYSTNYVTLQKL